MVVSQCDERCRWPAGLEIEAADQARFRSCVVSLPQRTQRSGRDELIALRREHHRAGTFERAEQFAGRGIPDAEQAVVGDGEQRVVIRQPMQRRDECRFRRRRREANLLSKPLLKLRSRQRLLALVGLNDVDQFLLDVRGAMHLAVGRDGEPGRLAWRIGTAPLAEQRHERHSRFAGERVPGAEHHAERAACGSPMRRDVRDQLAAIGRDQSWPQSLEFSQLLPSVAVPEDDLPVTKDRQQRESVVQPQQIRHRLARDQRQPMNRLARTRVPNEVAVLAAADLRLSRSQ